MPATPKPVDRLADIETRQEEVLRLLEELCRRIEETIRQHAPAAPAPKVAA
jgi:hypothetical protein